MSTYPFRVCLDSKLCLEGVFTPGEDEDPGFTTFTLPHYDPTLTVMVLSSEFGDDAGTIIEVEPIDAPTEEDSPTIVVSGDYSGGLVTVGRPFTARIDLTRPFSRSGDGTARTDTRTTVRRLVTSHTATGSYSVTATQTGRAAQTKRFLDADIEEDGTLAAIITGDARLLSISITDATPYPFTIHALDFTIGAYPRRE